MNRNFKHQRGQSNPPAATVGSHPVHFIPTMLALALIIVCGGANLATAQQAADANHKSPVEVSADVSKSVVQVAEPFGLDVTVTAPAGTKVFFPTVNSQLGQFDIVEQQDIFDVPLANAGDQRSWTRHLTLECIVTGELQIPPMEIQFTRDETTDLISTKALPIRVVSVLEDRADPTKFRDIKSVVDVEVPKQKSNAWMFWTLGGLGAGALSLATVVLVTRRKKYLTPSQWAISELEPLQNSPALQDADAESVLQDVSTILRDYLELQFEISAPAQTTQEFLKFAEHSQIVDLPTAKRFADLFSMADQAKFAGLQLTTPELQQVVESAIALVESVTTEIAAGQEDKSQDNHSQPSHDAEALR